MEVAEKKVQIIEIINTLENTKVLDALEKLLFKLKYEEEASNPMTLDFFNKEMTASFKDLEEGRVISSEDLQKEILSW